MIFEIQNNYLKLVFENPIKGKYMERKLSFLFLSNEDCFRSKYVLRRELSKLNKFPEFSFVLKK
tara:strand:- start:152 stop:343 length:192 start_codon:yes stop_codon:yes gene_type:complete